MAAEMGPPGGGPDVWDLLFEQTPTIVRWALGVLTFGIFTVLGVMYRWNREDVKRIDERVTTNIDSVHNRIESLEDRLANRLEEMNGHLIHIATNTRQAAHEQSNVGHSGSSPRTSRRKSHLQDQGRGSDSE